MSDTILRLVAVTLLLAGGSATAAEITLSHAEHPVKLVLGDIVTFEIAMDFRTGATLGGSFDIVFDPTALEYVGLTQAGLPGASNPTLGNGILQDWSVGSFTGLPEEATIGTVSFRILSAMCGSSHVGIRSGSSQWIAAHDFQPIAVTWHSASAYRADVGGVSNVGQIRIASSEATWLQVSEVVAMADGVDVATLANGATATGDGSGPTPGTFGGANHADNAINGVAPAPWPQIFHSDTQSATEFLLVTLPGTFNIDTLAVFGRSDSFWARDVYEVQYLDASGNTLLSCSRQSADNPINKAPVTSQPAMIYFRPTGLTTVSPGDIVTFDIYMDFTSAPTVGGGFDVVFDSLALEFLSFSQFDIGLQSFMTAPTFSPGVLSGWGHGDFDGLPQQAKLGSVTFRVLAPMCGSTFIKGRPTTGIAGPFLDFFTFTDYIQVHYPHAGIARTDIPAVPNVRYIRVTSNEPTWLQISEVVAIANDVDVATIGLGATASGDGTGAYPGTTGGANHANNAIDTIGPTAWPNIFTPDTPDPSEFLLVTLPTSYTIDGLSILGRTDVASSRDVYNVEFIDPFNATVATCRGQSAHNLAHEAVVIAAPPPDADDDGVADAIDNCQQLANADQIDTNADGIGNACDADLDNNCIVNAGDLGILRAAFFSTPVTLAWNPDADFTGDEVINAADLGVMRAAFFSLPGPSATGCN